MRIDLGGTLLCGSRDGDGPPLICLHGGPGCTDYLGGSALVGWLGHARSVICFDQRGGKYSPSKGPFTIESFVSDVEAVRAWTGAARIDILGHSWGAVLGVHYAAAHPKRVDRLALVSPAGVRPGWRSAFDATLKSRFTRSDRLRLEELDRRISEAKDAAVRRRLYHERFNVALPNYVDPKYRDRAPTMAFFDGDIHLKVNGSLQAHHQNRRWESRLREFLGDVAIIHGRSDPIPWSVIDELVELFPTAEVTGLDDCGHFPWLERPEALRRPLVAFFDDES